jgi:small subunit ribosomal protein S17
MTAVRGIVMAAAMKRTVTVRLETRARDPRYKKYVARRTTVYARDEIGCKVGDVVELTATRPLSKSIRWRVLRVAGRHAFATPPEDAAA